MAQSLQVLSKLLLWPILVSISLAFFIAFLVIPLPWIKGIALLTILLALLVLIRPLAWMIGETSSKWGEFLEIDQPLKLTFITLTDHFSRVGFWAVFLVAIGGSIKHAIQNGYSHAGLLYLGLALVIIAYIAVLALSGLIFLWRTVRLTTGATTNWKILFTVGYSTAFLCVCSLSTHFALAGLEGYLIYLEG